MKYSILVTNILPLADFKKRPLVITQNGRAAAVLIIPEEDDSLLWVGWILQEVGNRYRPTEEVFLNQHYGPMLRTMLRYAIEKFPEDLRRGYLGRRVSGIVYV